MKTVFQALLSLIIVIPISAMPQDVIATLEIFDLQTNQRSVVLTDDGHFEAPNWSKDGLYLIINQGGALFKVTMDGKKERIYTGFANRCNNDHGISPDGKTIALSHHLEEGKGSWLTSAIFTVPIDGGEPKRVTQNIPSFWHGWSPDGQTLVYTAQRDEEFDIYSIPAKGGKEIRLTNTIGLDDGSEYSPDGKYIYYNAMQSGKMEIWQMHADGSNQKQLTNDAYSNWFPHPSPNGKQFVFISYLEDQGSAHPAMQKVELRLYDVESKSLRTLCEFIGGQGSLNVPSWAPSGKQFAFVSYRYN